jgi:prolyl-tRNA synthetase
LYPLSDLSRHKVVVIVMNPKDEDLQSKALEVYTHLNESHGLKGEVVLDDRHDNPGPKIKDAQLLGTHKPCTALPTKTHH